MILRKIFSNCYKPHGVWGKLIIHGMDIGHSYVSNWGIGNLPPTEFHSILDIGCGGGRCVKIFLEQYPKAKVTAIDHSKLSVKKTSSKNADAIKTGRLNVIEGNVAALPFNDNTYDLVTAFETIYFWPGPLESFKEVYRVLDNGGIFMIVNEVDGISPTMKRWQSLVENLAVYETEEILGYLAEAGFKTISHNKKNHWLCVIAQK